MDDNKFKISLEEGKACQICQENFESTRKRAYHVRKEHGLSFEEYVVKVYFDGEKPKCKCGCGKELSFKGRKLGPWFSNYTKNHFPRNSHSDETKRKIGRKTKEAIEDKFGVENVFKLDSIKKKIKETKKKKYGDENYNNIGRNVQKQLFSQYERLNTEERLPNLKPLFSREEYCGTDIENKYPFRCKICGTEFISHLDCGRVPDCPTCSPDGNQSENERWLYKKIKDEVSVPVKRNDRSLLDGNEIDILIPGRGFALEYNSLYYHGFNFLGSNIDYHVDKKRGCERKGVELIHIFSDDFFDYKQEIENSVSLWFSKEKYQFFIRNNEVFVFGNKIGEVLEQTDSVLVKLFGIEVEKDFVDKLKYKFDDKRVVFDRGAVSISTDLNYEEVGSFVWWTEGGRRYKSFSNVRDYNYFDKVPDSGYYYFE